MEEQQQQYLGLSEVAMLLNIDRRKLSGYISRKKFPLPAMRVKATPLWTHEQITKYSQEKEALDNRKSRRKQKFTDEKEVAETLTAAGYGMNDIYRLVLLSPVEMEERLGSGSFQKLLGDKLK